MADINLCCDFTVFQFECCIAYLFYSVKFNNAVADLLHASVLMLLNDILEETEI